MKNYLILPMKKRSTLIYFVNNFQANLSPKSKVDKAIENSLSTMDFEPSERSIKNILDFARSYDVLKTKSTGVVEMIVN